MQYGLRCWRTDALWAWLLAMGLSLALPGCNRNRPPAMPSAQKSQPAVIAERAAAVIAAVCTRQSYQTASLGLIAGETKLREDVFELRDPSSYRIVPFRLSASIRLETLLRREAEAAGRPAEQADCIRQFADYFRSLSDPLVEAEKDEKDIDVSAFRDAETEAQQEIEFEEQQIPQQTQKSETKHP